MKKTIVTVAILIIVVIGIYYIIVNNNQNQTVNVPATTSQTTKTAETPAAAPASNIVAPANVAISIKNFSFSPSAVNVKVGDKVTWTNNDSAPHTITSDAGGILNSATLAKGQSFSFTFSEKGSVKYHCAIHPMMKGEIVVTD